MRGQGNLGGKANKVELRACRNHNKDQTKWKGNAQARVDKSKSLWQARVNVNEDEARRKDEEKCNGFFH